MTPLFRSVLPVDDRHRPPRAGPSLRGLVAALAVLTLAGGVWSACAVNPATGERQLMLVGRDQEIAMGRQTAEQVRSTMGLYDGQGLQPYIEEIGLRMARDSERPDLPWSFEVADEPAINAFAAPGGFLYFTRGILAHFNSEGELAAVMGHEIGHVTARHSAAQMSQQQVAQLGLGLGAALSEDVAALSDVLGAGLGVLFLKFSREDERQADRLGFRYMLSHGYDPHEMVDVFQMFRRMSAAGGGGGVPNWLSTHPTPASRIDEIREMIDSVAPVRVSEDGRETYLRRIEGMVYGPDPRHGFFQGDRFVHPELEFQLAFPGGWQRNNMARSVAAVSPEGDAQVQLTLADGGSPRQAAESFLQSQGVEGLRTGDATIHGFPAVLAEFRAQGQQSVLHGLAAFVQDGSRVYRLLGLAPEGVFPRRESTFSAFVRSFRRMDDPDVLGVEPLRLELVTPDRATTLAALASRRGTPPSVTVDDLALLNHLEPDETIPAGRTVKWVAGRLPEAMQGQGGG